MVVDKGLLLKGLGVCAVCAGGVATIHFKGREIRDFFSPYEAIREKKIEVAGLECVEAEGGECSIKNGEKVFVKRGNDNHFELTDLGKGKIKRYKDSGYEGGYKFLIEDNDIGSEENKKLEEFETYEIKKGEEDGGELKGKEYLFRKTNTKEEIKNSLGLGCEISTESSPQDCTIKDNKVGSVTITGGTVTLSISKETDREDYPLGYRFTFKNTNETAANLTVGSKTIALKNSSPMDFKIKKSGSSLALEKAWTLESLSRKVGIECKDGYCSPKEGGEILVKKETNTHFKVSSLGEGKIKVYEVEGEDYNENLKFSIEEKEIVGTNGENNKLEEFESYEIKKGGSDDTDLNGKYYFSRKGDAKAGIKKALGLPSTSCELPTDNNASQDCTITGNNKIGSLTISGGTVTLSISKETDFPLGYKFTFKNTGDGDSTLTTIGKETVTLKKNSPVEFKIKKEGSSLSLEKAWTLEELAKKVGIKKDSEEGYWTVDSAGINVKVDTTKKEKIEKYTDNQGKIKLYKDQANHNEGLKFIIEKGDLKLKEYKNQGSTSPFYLGQFQSYEIVKDGDGKWYLSKKEGEEAKVKELLGLKCELPTGNTTSSTCDITGTNISTMKFDGAGTGSVTVTGSPKLTIHKESGKIDYPLDYRFNFSSGDSDSTIIIPSSSSSSPSITLKQGLSVDYKIKRSGDNNQSLSLERAWTPKVLMENAVGFAAGSNNNEWSESGDLGIAIKQDNSSSSKAETKGTKNAKIRVYEGTPGYNQGMKFVIEDGDTDLTGGNGISKLTKYETYEVVKDGSDKQWYFTRKKKSEESIRELLGIPETCSMPTTTECDLDDSALKAIKFDGKGDGAVTTTGSGSMKLSISKENSETEYPLGFKFTFNPDDKEITIPQGSSSLTVKKDTNTEFKIKVGDKSNLTLEKAK